MKTKKWVALPVITSLIAGSTGCVEDKKEPTNETARLEQRISSLEATINKAKKLDKNSTEIRTYQDVQNAISAWLDVSNEALKVNDGYNVVRGYFNAGKQSINNKKYDEAISFSQKALEAIGKFNVRPPNLKPGQQNLEDDLYRRLGWIYSRTGKTREMFENYYKALVGSTKYNDSGVKNPTGDELYNISKSHSNKNMAQEELEKLTPDEKEIVLRDITFRAVRTYINEQHIEDMRGVIERIKRINEIYGLADRERVRGVVKEYFALPGTSPVKQKEKALALKGYNDIPIIRFINEAITAHR